MIQPDPALARQCVALAPLVAVITAFLIPIMHMATKSRFIAWLISELGMLFALAASAYAAFAVYSGGDVITYEFAAFPPPLGITYIVDHINAFIGLLVASVFFLVNIFAYTYIKGIGGDEWYYTIMMGMEAGLLGIAYTGDIFNLFVMMEVASVATYAVIAFRRERGHTLEASTKYAFIGAVATTVYFLAAVMAYYSFGTLNMANIAAIVMNYGGAFSTYFGGGFAANPYLALAVFLGLAAWALMIEAALFPMHFWLPDAYSAAPATASASLAAVAEGVYVYAIARLMYTVGGAEHVEWLKWVMLVLGSAAVIFGGYALAIQNGLKKMIAYSAVLDVGFMFIGLGIGSQAALTATLYYVLSHAVVKPLLFMVAGATEHSVGTTSLAEIGGRLRASPILGFGLLVGGLAVAGVVPLNLFFAKLGLVIASIEAGLYPLIIIIAIGSALALVGFMRAFYAAYFNISKPVDGIEVPASFKAMILLFAIGVIATGVAYYYLAPTVIEPAARALLDPAARKAYVDAAQSLLNQVVTISSVGGQA